MNKTILSGLLRFGKARFYGCLLFLAISGFFAPAGDGQPDVEMDFERLEKAGKEAGILVENLPAHSHLEIGITPAEKKREVSGTRVARPAFQ